MNLEKNQTLIEGEIVITVPVILSDQGNIENKEDMEKCPHCCKGVGVNFAKSTNGGGEKIHLSFSCETCKRVWFVRFQVPFRKFNL